LRAARPAINHGSTEGAEGASAKLENYRNWLVKRQGLEITFDPYQVGPYVAGPQYVTIPYKALAKIINPAGPLAPFLK
jgi:hypothetical protein